MTFSMKRVLSVILAAVMVFGMLPPAAVHADAAGLCEHLSEHQAHCSFTPADPGNACACTETDETGALLHLDGCGYRAPSEGVDCTCVCDTCLQAATPSDAAAPEVTDPPQPQKSQAALDTEALIAPLPGLWEAVAASLDEDGIPDEGAYQAFASAVSSARAAWDALSPEDQAQVSSYATLEQYGAYVISNNATSSHSSCLYESDNWQPLSGEVAAGRTEDDGFYFLTDDAVVTKLRGTVCLNGKTLTTNSFQHNLNEAFSVTICDCTGTGKYIQNVLFPGTNADQPYNEITLKNIHHMDKVQLADYAALNIEGGEYGVIDLSSSYFQRIKLTGKVKIENMLIEDGSESPMDITGLESGTDIQISLNNTPYFDVTGTIDPNSGVNIHNEYGAPYTVENGKFVLPVMYAINLPAGSDMTANGYAVDFPPKAQEAQNVTIGNIPTGSAIVVTTASGEDVEVRDGNTFTMPAADVNVTVSTLHICSYYPDVSAEEWTKVTASGPITVAGYYYLGDDSPTGVYPNGAGVVLCLNGHNIAAHPNTAMSGTICDCKKTAKLNSSVAYDYSDGLSWKNLTLQGITLEGVGGLSDQTSHYFFGESLTLQDVTIGTSRALQYINGGTITMGGDIQITHPFTIYGGATIQDNGIKAGSKIALNLSDYDVDYGSGEPLFTQADGDTLGFLTAVTYTNKDQPVTPMFQARFAGSQITLHTGVQTITNSTGLENGSFSVTREGAQIKFFNNGTDLVACEGDTVSISQENMGQGTALLVSDENGAQVTVTTENGVSSFTMPSGLVTVSMTHSCAIHTGITDWIPISENGDSFEMQNGGHYYLTRSVSISELYSKADGSIEPVLCLNGNTLTVDKIGGGVFYNCRTASGGIRAKTDEIALSGTREHGFIFNNIAFDGCVSAGMNTDPRFDGCTFNNTVNPEAYALSIKNEDDYGFILTGKTIVTGKGMHLTGGTSDHATSISLAEGSSILLTMEPSVRLQASNQAKYFVHPQKDEGYSYGNDAEGYLVVQEPHKHTGESFVWKEFTGTVEESDGLSPVCYYLTDNWTKDWTVQGGTVSYPIQLCLNGKTFSGKITVAEGSYLTIVDCKNSGDVTGVVEIKPGGDFTTRGGWCSNDVIVREGGSVGFTSLSVREGQKINVIIVGEGNGPTTTADTKDYLTVYYDLGVRLEQLAQYGWSEKITIDPAYAIKNFENGQYCEMSAPFNVSGTVYYCNALEFLFGNKVTPAVFASSITMQDFVMALPLYQLNLAEGVAAASTYGFVSYGAAPKLVVITDQVTLTVPGDKGIVQPANVTDLKKQSDGTYTFTMPASDVTIETTTLHSHGEGDPLNWYPFTGTFVDGKAYYLTGDWDTETDGAIIVNAGTLNDTTQNLRLCLNGKQIYGDITVNQDEGIVICDCQNNTGFVHGDIDVYGALQVGGESYLPGSILAERVIVREGCTYLDLAGVSANNGQRMPVIMQGTPQYDLTFFHPAVLYYYGYDAFEVMLTSLGWADVAEIDETETQTLENESYYAYVKLKEPVTYLSGTIGWTEEGVLDIVYEVKTAAAGDSLALYDLALSRRMYTLTVSPGITVVIPEEMAAYVQDLGSGAWMVPAAFSVTLTGISEDAILSYTGVDDSDVTQAEDTDTPGNVTYTFDMPASDVTVEILHQHPVFTNGQDVLWEEFTGTVEPGKNYYLSADYAQPLNIDTGTVSICLNGFTISGKITVAKDAQLNLVDHHGGGVVAGVVDVSGSLNTQAGRYTQYVIARSGSSNYIQATADSVKVPVLMDGLGVSQNQQDFQENYYKTQLHLQDKGWTGKVTYQSGTTKVVDGTTYYAASAEFTVAQPVIYLTFEGYLYFPAAGETITAEAIAVSLPMYTLTVPENVSVNTDIGPDYIIPDAEPAEKYYVYVIPEYMDEFITWFNSTGEGDNKLTFPFPKFSVVLTAPADYKLAVKTNNVTMKEEPAGTYTFAMPTNDVEIGLTHNCILHPEITNWIPVTEKMDKAPAGNYYLTANNLSFTAGESGVTLCLNGHTLNNLYLDVETQNFEVCDCTGTGRIEMQGASMFSTWWPVDIIMNGVTISGGMCVISEGTLTLKDVTMESGQTGMILNNEEVSLSGKVVINNVAMFLVDGTTTLKDAGLADGSSLDLTVDVPSGGPAVLIDQAKPSTLSRINSIKRNTGDNPLMAYYDAESKQVMLDKGFAVTSNQIGVTVERKVSEAKYSDDTGSTTVGFEGDIITIAKPAAGYKPEVSSNVTDLTEQPDGSYTFTMPRGAVTITLEQKNPIYSITIPATLSLAENDQQILTNSLTFSVNTWENMDSYQVTASYSGPSAPVLTHEQGPDYGQLPLTLEFGDAQIDLDETGGYDVFHTFTSKDNISVNVSAPVKNDAFVGTYTGTMNFSFSCISTQTE